MSRARLLFSSLLALALGGTAWLLCPPDDSAPPGGASRRARPTAAPGPVLEGTVEPAAKGGPNAGTRAPSGREPSSVDESAETTLLEGRVTGGWVGIDLFLVAEDEPTPPRIKGGGWDPTARPTKTTTDSSGWYTVRCARGWTGVLVARVSHTYEVRSAVIHAAQARQRVDLALPEPATLRVRLASQTGERPRLRQLGVEGEFVWYALGSAAEQAGGFLEDERDGRAVSLEATPGRVKVTGWIESGPSIEREATLVSGETTEVLLQVPGDGVVRGRVVDPQGRKLLGAWVTWEGERRASGSVDEHGGFRLFGTGRARGTLSVDARVAPLLVLEGSREDVEPDGEPIDVRLEPGARVLVRVAGLKPGDAVTRAIVSRSHMNVWSGPIQEDGSFEMRPPQGEPALLVVFQVGRAPLVVDMPPFREGEVRDLGTVWIVPGIDVQGRVTDGAGLALAGAEVTVVERWSRGFAHTDEAGRFHLPHMPARPFLVRVRDPRFPQHLVTVDPVATPSPEIVLRAGGTVVIRVTDATGSAVPGADVTAFPVGEFPYEADFSQTRRTVTTDAEGTIRAPMAAGPRRLRAETPRGATSEDATITVREGETTAVTLVLRDKPPR